MKKILALILTLTMALGLITGCGGSEGKEETPVKEETAKAGLENGYWVVDSMVMEGSEFDKESMEGIFGPAETIMVLAFGANGEVNGVYFEDLLKGTYTGTLEGFEFEVYGEKASGKVSEDGKMELKMAEDSSFILVNQKEMPESLAKNPWVTYQVEFDAKETMAMSNFMSYGRYLVEDDVVYGLTHAKSNNGSLGATSFHMKGDFPEFDETKILADGYATYLTKQDDALYFIMDYNSVCRVGIDGKGFEVLYDGACDYLQIHDGRLYFSDEDYHFVTTDMDGKDLKTVVDREVYYPYFIASDWMIFQDDADDESLHLYNTTHGTELNITYVPSYCPILDEHYLYYMDYVDECYYLQRIDMSDPETFRCEASEMTFTDGVFLIDDVRIYTSNDNSEDKENWKKLSNTDTDITEAEVYVSEGYKIYHELDAQGLISGKYLMSKEKFGGTSFK